MTKRPALQPRVWEPTPYPDRARRRIGTAPLPPLTLRHAGGSGPEDVLVEADGSVLSGLADGRVVRIAADGRPPVTVARTGGRPLGLEHLRDGRVLVCDADRGLLALDPQTGDVAELVTEVAGRPMLFCNNAAVTRDGTIWFSDSSTRFGIAHWKAEMLEHSGTGRLLRRDPSGQVEVVLEGLEFANGVALAPDESCVVVAETGASRLTRLHLSGPRAGHAELLVDLPAYPDNASTGTDGLLWVALPSPRDPLLGRLAARPRLRKAAWALPVSLQPKEKRIVWVAAYTFDGELVHDLQGTHRDFWMSVGVREHQGVVHIGSLAAASVASFELPAPGGAAGISGAP